MKIALKDGQILIKEADENQFLIIKSWGKMKWSKAQQMLYGPAAIDGERMKEKPKPLYKYPVKLPLYQHQTRGANMALLAFGLIEPPGKEAAHEKK